MSDLSNAHTQFLSASAQVAQRITAAPVDEWLKKEAREDLRRLAHAHNLNIYALMRDHQKAITTVKEELNARYVSEMSEMKADRPTEAREYKPSDYDMRQMAMHASNGSVESARAFYAFLKDGR